MMKKVFNFIYKCHKWFGIPLALMFIMWYCSGIIMMYHSFPRVAPSDMKVEKADSTVLANLWAEVPDTVGSCKISFSGGRMLIAADGETYGAYQPTLRDLEKIASTFDTEVAKVDTLDDLDKWTPFNRLMKHLPFYKIVGSDGANIYVSSKTGEILQYSTVSERRWAWFGALPHYVYITPIRRDVGLWKEVVVWMSGLSTVSVIFGLIIAFRFLFKRRRLNVFKKKSWQWHYSFGLFFGIFMLAFIFSGMMSLANIPDWIMKSRELAETPTGRVAKSDISLKDLPEEFCQASLTTDPQLMWVVNKGKKSKTYSASGAPLDFSIEYMTPIIERQTGEKVIDAKPISEDFFYHRGGVDGLRADTEHFTVYWNEKGYYRILDKKAKAQYVCYRFLHTMKIPGIYDVKWLHSVYMWVILLGGLVVVGTGTVLSFRTVVKKNRKS